MSPRARSILVLIAAIGIAGCGRADRPELTISLGDVRADVLPQTGERVVRGASTKVPFTAEAKNLPGTGSRILVRYLTGPCDEPATKQCVPNVVDRTQNGLSIGLGAVERASDVRGGAALRGLRPGQFGIVEFLLCSGSRPERCDAIVQYPFRRLPTR